MEVISCQGVVVARIRFQLDWIGPKVGLVELREKVPNKEQYFRLWVPKKVVNQLKLGDVFEALCAVSSDLMTARETFVLAKREGTATINIFSAGQMWSDMFFKMIR